MDTARYDQTLNQLRARIASLPAEQRAALEALAEETAARQREIAASHDETTAVAEGFYQATARFHDAATRMADSPARVLDKIQDALIDLNCIALDLESQNRRRNGAR
jgi:TRAP-type C4-dicarboxylate transport system substrate-binding protein